MVHNAHIYKVILLHVMEQIARYALQKHFYGCFQSLPMDCYGSEHCCRPENQCDLYEGDCNTDNDCLGMD